MQSYRCSPQAYTNMSYVAKTFERLRLRGAIIFLTHQTITHLEKQ